MSMKKYLFLSLLSLLFLSCNTESNSINPLVFENNEIDSNFTCQIYNNTAGDEEIHVFHNTREGYLNGYKRLSGTTGVVGKWIKKYDTYSREVTLNTDNTFTMITTEDNEIDKDSGQYEIIKENDIYYIIIEWNFGSKIKQYKLEYVVSDNYFCHEQSGCPL
jgi:hypothetical protein